MGMSSQRLNRCSSESVCRAPACPPWPCPAFPCDKYSRHSFPIFFASFLLPAPACKSRRTVSTARPPGRLWRFLEPPQKGQTETHRVPFSYRRKCPYRYCQVHGPAAQRRRAGGTACGAGTWRARRPASHSRYDMSAATSGCQLANPTPNTRSLLLFSRHRPPDQRTDSLAAARISSGHGCVLLFAFCWCRPSPARPSPVYHLAPSTCHQMLVFLESCSV